MKKIILISCLWFAVGLASCGNTKTEKTTTAPVNAVVMYECPMKCVPASNQPGKCSKCGMDLVKK